MLPHTTAPVLTAGAPLASATYALILTHGRGADAEGMFKLAGARCRTSTIIYRNRNLRLIKRLLDPVLQPFYPLSFPQTDAGVTKECGNPGPSEGFGWIPACAGIQG